MSKSAPLLAFLLALAAPSANAGSRISRGSDDSARRESFLADVLTHLERHPSPIAANTAEALASGRIVVDTLDRLTVADCRMLLEENPAQWSGLVSVDECVDEGNGRARVPKRVLQRVSGYQTENRIYLRPGTAVRDAAATVVHETNHVANATHEHYSTAKEKLAEEYRAYWVALVYQDGKAPNAAYLAWLKGWIIEQYALSGVTIEDVPDEPAGVIDNRLPAVPVARAGY